MKQLVVLPGKITNKITNFALIDPDNGKTYAIGSFKNYNTFLNMVMAQDKQLIELLSELFVDYEIVMIEDTNYDIIELVKKQGKYYYDAYRAN